MTGDLSADYKKEANAHLAEWRSRIERLRVQAEELRLTAKEAATDAIAGLNECMARIEQELCALDNQSAEAAETTRARIEDGWLELDRRYREVQRSLAC